MNVKTLILSALAFVSATSALSVQESANAGAAADKLVKRQRYGYHGYGGYRRYGGYARRY